MDVEKRLMDVERHKNRPDVGNRSGPETSINNNNNNNNSNNKEHDRFLPIANVGRIMKKVIPANGKISKDAKETVQECVSEFISFVTGEASDKCQREKRKTINGDDVVWAISILGFEDYVNPLKHYLHKYRELEEEKLHVPKQQQQRSDQQQQPRLQQQHPQQHHLDHEQIMSYSSLYTPHTSTLMSMPSFVSTDQPFPLPFPPSSIQRQLHHQQEDIDSAGHW